ncbi:response regulator [Croceitalea sp. MTPC9]|uniref:response regulator n=1 Tax=unclassified Croceitalea TaxID=2632280 RepID=UPI002B37B753|nr:response regulator [Croceitalea sp. MTPC6]GMN18288.1 response regulator [Croceitalea sp. MTPC9]
MKDIKNIFVVDDDSIMLFGMRKMLSKITEKSTVLEFKNGQTALNEISDRIKNGNVLPEVIFLDINMPILDGWGFLEEFTQLDIKERILINIITSSIDPNDREKWLSFRKKTHHYIDFVNKPIYKIELKDLHKMDMAS